MHFQQDDWKSQHAKPLKRYNFPLKHIYMKLFEYNLPKKYSFLKLVVWQTNLRVRDLIILICDFFSCVDFFLT